MNEIKKPLVSVVIMTYRNFDFVYETIDSVLDQDYPEMELLIADDGSGNFPREKIEDYIVKHKKSNIQNINIYTNEKNLGTVRNSNIAHSKVNGEYIVSMAGDDVLYDKKVVSEIIARMEETGCGLLAGSRLVMNENGESLYYLPHQADRKRMMRLSREKQYRMFVSGMFYAMFSGSSLAFRTSSFREIGGFDEKYTLWEDGPFIEKFLRTGRIEPAFDITTIRYRLGGVSSGPGHPKLAEDMEIYNASDRIARLDETGWFYRALTIYNIGGENKKSLIKKLGLAIGPVLVYKVWYKIRFQITEKMDIIQQKKDKRKG